MFRCFIAITALFTASLSGANASEIRHQFNNPAFGGFANNGTYFLSNAQAQQTHEQASARSSAQQNFSNTITNSLLNRVALNISDTILDAGDGDSGTFSIDDTHIAYSRSGSLITIVLTNAASGESTTIELPATP